MIPVWRSTNTGDSCNHGMVWFGMMIPVWKSTTPGDNELSTQLLHDSCSFSSSASTSSSKNKSHFAKLGQCSFMERVLVMHTDHLQKSKLCFSSFQLFWDGFTDRPGCSLHSYLVCIQNFATRLLLFSSSYSCTRGKNTWLFYAVTPSYFKWLSQILIHLFL